MMAATIPSWLANATIVVAALGVIGVVFRQIGPWRKQITETEEHLRRELTERHDLMVQRVEKMERRLEKQQLRHNAERALDRHRLNNIVQCFDSMILLIEMSPDRAPEIVAKIKEMRAAQILAEAEEKAIIRAAEITADDGEMDHDGN